MKTCKNYYCDSELGCTKEMIMCFIKGESKRVKLININVYVTEITFLYAIFLAFCDLHIATKSLIVQADFLGFC